ncbi:hypothetical protein H822_YJM1444G00121 [Saccharomyces cerevisiae YJM1444]|nr:hypothetical protein H822_YJM1444G00121 [Saccharomyces cerevisiae YJM1444]CAI4468008.1 CCC_1a_G0018870.mRNA.1.CDS.1 [Saccharomyces cerevisiae]CAI7290409.1 CCC_1a_G0018870.mRNA.1.CDS.1 [Saccharomyces cerevisiae]
MSLKSKLTKIQKLWLYYFPCDRILAKRICKSTVNTTVAFIFCLIPKITAHLGAAPAMLPMISVIVHPGRRVGGTIHGAIYCITGLIFGLAYAIFGRFLAQRCLGSSWHELTEAQQHVLHYKRYEAGLAILAVFEVIMLFFHGWMRSVSHYYFGIVFPLFVVVHFAFMDPLNETAGTIAKAYSTPFYLGIAMSIFWNLVLFPEWGTTYLGNTTIDAMNELHKSIDYSINFFIAVDPHNSSQLYSRDPVSLGKLLKMKSLISSKVNNCRVVLHECIYEFTYAYVSPTKLKPIISTLENLTVFINGLVNTCQLEFILLARHDNKLRPDDVAALTLPKNKEISFANAEKLLKVIDKLHPVIYSLHRTMSECMYMAKLVLAHAFDVKVSRVHSCSMFKDGNFPTFSNSANNLPNDVDIQNKINDLKQALEECKAKFKSEMLSFDIDIMSPSDEMFLLSSFLLNFRQTADSTLVIMESVKDILVKRQIQEKKGWLRGKRLWFLVLTNYETFSIWLKGDRNSVTENDTLKGTFNGNTNGFAHDTVIRRPDYEENELLSQKVSSNKNIVKDDASLDLPMTSEPKGNSSSTSDTSSSPLTLTKTTTFGTNRTSRRQGRFSFMSMLISIDKFCEVSHPHFRFGFQVAIALMLASFPMFIPKTRQWYIDYRGTWIGFVCILCLEPSVGGTFWVFFLRAVGVIFGAAWGYLSYVAAVNQTNPYLETVITVFGAIPGFYYLLGTPYVKAAIIEIISIYIVMLAAILPSQDDILTSFAKRCLAVGYGGGVALIVQVFFFPLKAREQLNEEISFVCGCISEMELLYATGLEGEQVASSMSEEKYKKIEKISKSAKEALARATAYKGLTRQEPRLKGEYTELENVFTQVIFIQKQIIERIDTISLLRKQNGSAVIEEFNSVVYPYRRQMVGSISCLMRALQEAFINKTPLPQFLPSARIAHRRLINKVRQTLRIRYPGQISNLSDKARKPNEGDYADGKDEDDDDNEGLVMKMNRRGQANTTANPHEYVLKEKFLSWNASSAASEEIIEYIEELLNLTKILVGVNEFKYGFLSRPLYEDWAAEAVTGFDNFINGKSNPMNTRRNRTPFDGTSIISEGNESLQSTNSNESQISPDSTRSYEPECPVAYEKNDNPAALNLLRIASHKAGQNADGLPKTFRNRAFSIASTSGQLSSLSRHSTLGNADPNYLNDDDESSDDDLPLALKMVLSHMKEKKD